MRILLSDWPLVCEEADTDLDLRQIAKSRFHALEVWKRDLD
jgi:hypothetical protein